MGLLTKEEHLEIHKKLHKALDELVADYISLTGRTLSESSIIDLIHWSFEQSINPKEKE
jgi:hypothetical protein